MSPSPQLKQGILTPAYTEAEECKETAADYSELYKRPDRVTAI